MGSRKGFSSSLLGRGTYSSTTARSFSTAFTPRSGCLFWEGRLDEMRQQVRFHLKVILNYQTDYRCTICLEGTPFGPRGVAQNKFKSDWITFKPIRREATVLHFSEVRQALAIFQEKGMSNSRTNQLNEPKKADKYYQRENKINIVAQHQLGVYLTNLHLIFLPNCRDECTASESIQRKSWYSNLR